MVGSSCSAVGQRFHKGCLLVRMKAAPVKTDGERLGNEFVNGVFFSAHLGVGSKRVQDDTWL